MWGYCPTEVFRQQGLLKHIALAGVVCFGKPILAFNHHPHVAGGLTNPGDLPGKEIIMKFFEKKVDLRSRSAMEAFLATHRRYGNHGTSYANLVKVHHLALSSEQLEKAWDVMGTDYWLQIDEPISEFTDRHHGQWTIGSDGRSGGYLVLYQSYRKQSEHKSFCPKCGQKNFNLVQPLSDSLEDSRGSRCGVCGGERLNFTAPHYELVVNGRSVDQWEDFSDWSIEDLRRRVRLVQDFDRTCDQIRTAFIDLLDECEVVEEEVVTVSKVKRLACAA